MGMEWPNKYTKKGEWEERKGKSLEKFKKYKSMLESRRWMHKASKDGKEHIVNGAGTE